jgi:hypothetical protein
MRALGTGLWALVREDMNETHIAFIGGRCSLCIPARAQGPAPLFPFLGAFV